MCIYLQITWRIHVAILIRAVQLLDGWVLYSEGVSLGLREDFCSARKQVMNDELYEAAYAITS